MVTFGSPRVGPREFADYSKRFLENRILRVVNKADLVPHVPPHKIFTYEFYTHVPTEVWLLDEGKIKKCSTANGEDLTCSYQVSNDEKNIGDHSLYPGGIFDCENSVQNECRPKCVNGYCKDKKCVCYDGFSGNTCAIPDSLCSPPCIHGKCLRGNNCICNRGFGGRSCNLICHTTCYAQCHSCLRQPSDKFCSDYNGGFACNQCNSRSPISDPQQCERFCCQLQ